MSKQILFNDEQVEEAWEPLAKLMFESRHKGANDLENC